MFFSVFFLLLLLTCSFKPYCKTKIFTYVILHVQFSKTTFRIFQQIVVFLVLAQPGLVPRCWHSDVSLRFPEAVLELFLYWKAKMLYLETNHSQVTWERNLLYTGHMYSLNSGCNRDMEKVKQWLWAVETATQSESNGNKNWSFGATEPLGNWECRNQNHPQTDSRKLKLLDHSMTR